jgi:hypothetical protein
VTNRCDDAERWWKPNQPAAAYWSPICQLKNWDILHQGLLKAIFALIAGR